MRIQRAPSWPIVIGSGLAGGAVNWFLDSTWPGIVVFVVFAVVSSLLIVVKDARKQVAGH